MSNDQRLSVGPAKFAIALVAALLLAGAVVVGVWTATANAATPADWECKGPPQPTRGCHYTGEEVGMLLTTNLAAGGFGYPPEERYCTVEFTVDWGDGTTTKETLSPISVKLVTHKYAKPGFYTIVKKGTPIQPSGAACSAHDWGYVSPVPTVKIVKPSVRITKLNLMDIDNKPLKYLSTDDHAYKGGKTLVHGTITVEGRPQDSLDYVSLRVYDRTGKFLNTEIANLAPGAKKKLLTKFGSDRKISIDKPTLLFELSSANAAKLDSDVNGDLELEVFAMTNTDAQADRTFGSVQKLVRYDAGNRYGQRDETAGGDDWAKPSVRTVAKHFAGNQWGDFSNMNGGSFPPHGSHRTGNDIDGKFAGYPARDADVADTIIGHLNDDTYGGRIERVFVTFNAPGTKRANWLGCEAGRDNGAHADFWDAIQGVTLDDGRAATDVIRPIKGHCTHFHWRVSD